MEQDWLVYEDSLTYVADEDTASHRQSQAVDDPSTPYAPVQGTGELVPYQAEVPRDLTRYQEALGESLLFRQPMPTPHSVQEPYHLVASPEPISVPGPAHKKVCISSYWLDQYSMPIERFGVTPSDSSPNDSNCEGRSTSSQCWEVWSNPASDMCDRPQVNANSDLSNSRSHARPQDSAAGYQSGVAASSRDPANDGAVSAPIGTVTQSHYGLEQFVFCAESTPGSRLTGSHMDALNALHETNPDDDDDDTKSNDSLDSMHTSHNSSVDQPAYMAEQRLNGFVAAGSLSGGFGGRTWAAQGRQRKKDKRTRAYLHQLGKNWATGQAPVPRNVQQRLNLCVLRDGQPVEVEQTPEGASKLAGLFSQMLDAAKRSCLINVV